MEEDYIDRGELDYWSDQIRAIIYVLQDNDIHSGNCAARRGTTGGHPPCDCWVGRGSI